MRSLKSNEFAGERFAQSMLYVHEYPRELPILRDLLSGIATPAKILAGVRDGVVPPINAEFVAERLPNAELAIVDSGRFMWEDAADTFADHAISWWQRH